MDAVAKHVLILHALAGTLGSVRAAEAEDGGALGHAQHLAATVVGQSAEPELDGVAEALVTDDWEVVHIEEVETGLREGRHSVLVWVWVWWNLNSLTNKYAMYCFKGYLGRAAVRRLFGEHKQELKQHLICMPATSKCPKSNNMLTHRDASSTVLSTYLLSFKLDIHCTI